MVSQHLLMKIAAAGLFSRLDVIPGMFMLSEQ